jgi:hypothetical protein
MVMVAEKAQATSTLGMEENAAVIALYDIRNGTRWRWSNGESANAKLFEGGRHLPSSSSLVEQTNMTSSRLRKGQAVVPFIMLIELIIEHLYRGKWNLLTRCSSA